MYRILIICTKEVMFLDAFVCLCSQLVQTNEDIMTFCYVGSARPKQEVIQFLERTGSNTLDTKIRNSQQSNFQ